ncbi:TPA: Cro/CI family transcriptional regulator [Neisseria weaveri]
MDISKFINLIGGVTKVAELCGITKGAVSQWKKNGIPKAQMNFLKTKFPREWKKASHEK